jgi:hypothetical protein
MRKQVTLTIKEQKRLKVLNDLEAGMTKVKEVSDVLGLSLRHIVAGQSTMARCSYERVRATAAP